MSCRVRGTSANARWWSFWSFHTTWICEMNLEGEGGWYVGHVCIHISRENDKCILSEAKVEIFFDPSSWVVIYMFSQYPTSNLMSGLSLSHVKAWRGYPGSIEEVVSIDSPCRPKCVVTWAYWLALLPSFVNCREILNANLTCVYVAPIGCAK